ncbi:hypothetical protein [Caulobacter sp. CCG-8]|uniref:hypothetical protein n=1 Tax=Caulobacter sp. CCG-8 TaxID=3127958 RepID=UPI00307EB6D1
MSCSSASIAESEGYRIVRGSVKDCEPARALLNGGAEPGTRWLAWTAQNPDEQKRFIRRFPFSDIEFHERADVQGRAMLHGRITSHEPSPLVSMLALAEPGGDFFPIDKGYPVLEAKNIKLMPDPEQLFGCGACTHLRSVVSGYGITSDVAVIDDVQFQIYRSGRAGYAAMFRLSLSGPRPGVKAASEAICQFDQR